MEEEAERIAQGQVISEGDSFSAFIGKHNNSAPHSINSIFAPPTEVHKESTPITNTSAPLEKITEFETPLQKEPSSDSFHVDSDSDEGVGVELPDEKDAAAASNPTEEEVDAALAELDSIPDGACEAGDLEEEDSEEEEEKWEYYRMNPQPERQDDLLFEAEPNDAFSAQSAELIPSSVDEPIPIENLQAPLEEIPPPPMNIDVPLKMDSPTTGASPISGSPKTVESGFITSVELNAPEESYNTNVTINQSTDYFNTGQFEQNSGPFSVYVSNASEPESIEVPPHRQHSSMEEPSLGLPIVQDSIVSSGTTQGILAPESPVEIVHAQSMVEVISTGSPVQIDSPLKDEDGMPIAIPDIMTQSMTGDTHPDMFSPPSDKISEALSEQLERINISEPYNTFDSTNEDLFKNIPEANILDDHPLPVQPPSGSLIDHPPNETKTDLISTDTVPLDYRVLDEFLSKDEPSKDIEIRPQAEAVPPMEPDLVRDLEPPQVQPEALIQPDEPITSISPMDKIQQEFEQIEQVADEVMGQIKDTAPQEISPTEPIEPPKATEVQPSVKPELEKPKKEAPKAAPRTTTTKTIPKTTKSTTPTTKATTKEQPKETSKAAPRTRTAPTTKPPSKLEARKPATTKTTIAARTTAKTTTGATAKAPTTKSSTVPTRTATTTTSRAATKVPSTTRTLTKPSTTSTTRKPNSASSTASSQATKTTTTRTVASASSAALKRTTTRPVSSATRQSFSSTKTTTVAKTSTAPSTTTATRRPISSTKPSPSTSKDTKNTTNKILSSRTSTTSRISSTVARTSGTTTKSTVSRTTVASTNKTTTSVANRRPVSSTKPGMKAKGETKANPKSPTKSATTAAAPAPSAIANGENKIVEEESTCEVKEKLSPPHTDESALNSQADLIPSKASETTPVISDPPNEVLVNGDH